MKPSILAAAAAALALGACVADDPYFYHGALAEAHGRAVNARQYRTDVRTCDGGPGAVWCRIAADDGNLDRTYPLDMKPEPKGIAFAYDASQCAGAFEHGLCRGVSKPRLSSAPVCHGETIDGRCAGPVF